MSGTDEVGLASGNQQTIAQTGRTAGMVHAVGMSHLRDALGECAL
jgi:hypothetical protein